MPAERLSMRHIRDHLRLRATGLPQHIIAEISRLRVDRSGDEQQAADVRSHAVCQKPPAAASATSHRRKERLLSGPRGVKEFSIGESPPHHPHIYINMGEADTILERQVSVCSRAPKRRGRPAIGAVFSKSSMICSMPQTLARKRAERNIAATLHRIFLY
jgi:hypothetical protein